MSEPFVPGTEKPEELYEELSDLGRELGIPVPQTHLGLILTDPDGNIIEERYQRSRTWNRNYWNIFFSLITNYIPSAGTFGAGDISMKNTSGGTLPIRANYADTALSSYSIVGFPLARYWASSGQNNTLGIQVGTGTAAEDFEGFALGAKDSTLTWSFDASYTGGTPTYNASDKTWTASWFRTFTNNSGGSVQIAETGIYISTFTSVTENGVATVMICRDKLPSAIAIPSGGYSLRVNYFHSLTYPS